MSMAPPLTWWEEQKAKMKAMQQKSSGQASPSRKTVRGKGATKTPAPTPIYWDDSSRRYVKSDGSVFDPIRDSASGIIKRAGLPPAWQRQPAPKEIKKKIQPAPPQKASKPQPKQHSRRVQNLANRKGTAPSRQPQTGGAAYKKDLANYIPPEPPGFSASENPFIRIPAKIVAGAPEAAVGMAKFPWDVGVGFGKGINDVIDYARGAPVGTTNQAWSVTEQAPGLPEMAKGMVDMPLSTVGAYNQQTGEYGLPSLNTSAQNLDADPWNWLFGGAMGLGLGAKAAKVAIPLAKDVNARLGESGAMGGKPPKEPSEKAKPPAPPPINKPAIINELNADVDGLARQTLDPKLLDPNAQAPAPGGTQGLQPPQMQQNAPDIPIYRQGNESGNWWSKSKNYADNFGGSSPTHTKNLTGGENLLNLTEKGTIEFNRMATPEELPMLDAQNMPLRYSIIDKILERNGYDGFTMLDEGADGLSHESVYLRRGAPENAMQPPETPITGQQPGVAGSMEPSPMDAPSVPPPPQPPSAPKIASKFDMWKQGVSEELRTIYFNLVSNIEHLNKIDPSGKLYDMADRLGRVSGFSERIIKDGAKAAFEGNTAGKFVGGRWLGQSADSVAAELAMVRHLKTKLSQGVAPELLGEDVAGRIAKSDAIMSDLKMQDPKLAQGVENAATNLHELADFPLKHAVAKGVLSEELAAQWREKSPFYMYLGRIMQDIDMNVYSGRAKLGKRFRGSKRNILDPMDGIIESLTTLIKEIDSFALKNATIEKMLADSELSKQISSIEPIQGPKALEIVREIADDTGAPTGEVGQVIHFFRPNMDLGKNVIYTIKNGERQFWKIKNEMLVEMFNGHYNPDAIIKASSFLNQDLYRVGVVINPKFIIKNIWADKRVRQIFTAFDPRKSGFRKMALDSLAALPKEVGETFTSYPLALLRQMFDSETMRQLELHYAKGGEFAYKARGTKRLRKSIMTSKFPRPLVVAADWATHPVNAILRFGEMTEGLGRTITAIEIYKRYYEEYTSRGMAKSVAEDAAWQKAADAFARYPANYGEKGAYAGIRRIHSDKEFKKHFMQLMKTSSFWTARVSGANAEAKLVVRNPYGTAAKWMTVVGLPTIGVWLYNRNQAYYQELSTQEKNNFWHFSKTLRFPKGPSGFAAAASLLEGHLDWIADNDPKGVDRIKDAYLRMLNPGMPQPRWFEVPKGLMTNTKYGDSPIELPNEQDMPASARWGPNTSETSKMISEGLGPIADTLEISAPKIDYTVEGIFGPAGKYGLNTIDWTIDKLRGKDKVSPAQSWWEHPANPFHAKAADTSLNSDAINTFWKNYEKAKGYKDNFNKNIKTGDTPRIQRVFDPKMEAAYEITTELLTDMSDLNKAWKSIYNQTEGITSEQKRMKLDEIGRQMNLVAKEGNAAIEQLSNPSQGDTWWEKQKARVRGKGAAKMPATSTKAAPKPPLAPTPLKPGLSPLPLPNQAQPPQSGLNDVPWKGYDTTGQYEDQPISDFGLYMADKLVNEGVKARVVPNGMGSRGIHSGKEHHLKRAVDISVPNEYRDYAAAKTADELEAQGLEYGVDYKIAAEEHHIGVMILSEKGAAVVLRQQP